MHITRLSRVSSFLLAVMFVSTACGPKTPPPPTLIEGSLTQNFMYEREVVQRELRVTGSAPRVIPPRVFDVRYTLSCLSDTDGGTARSRYNSATKLIDEKMPRFVEGSTRSNPFYRIAWPAQTNRLIVEETGCEATNVEWIKMLEGRTEVLKWLVDNQLLVDLMLYSRGLR